MANKRNRTYEAPEMGAFALRTLKALARRAGEGDLEALTALREIGAALPTITTDAMVGAREFGYSLSEIADEMKVSRQAVSTRTAGAKVGA
jgi:DNA-directed RNA polymerase specialized sigma24 family protein